MRVYLDDQPIPIATPTLAAALAAVRESAELKRRVVIEVMRDGQPLPQNLLEAPTDAEEPGAELRCSSADPIRLVADSLRQAAVELSGAESAQTRAADAIHTARLEDAMPPLSAALSVWTQVHRVITDGPSLIGLDLATSIDGTPLIDSVRTLASYLAEIKRALQAQDWSGLADTLAYDLPSQVSHWKTVLNTLADRITEQVDS